MTISSNSSAVKLLVYIPADDVELEGELTIPADAHGLVIFAHGSGSSRHSPRNKQVAEVLHKRSLATLLVDLLSDEEDDDYENRFDIELLTDRLAAITQWATTQEHTSHLALGYFGASTGAAAAIRTAVANKETVRALVCRGGRVDLAQDVVDRLEAPTMLIVGEKDNTVRVANEEFFTGLQSLKNLAEIPQATHLFEEPGTMEKVARLASMWFSDHLDPFGQSVTGPFVDK